MPVVGWVLLALSSPLWAPVVVVIVISTLLLACVLTVVVSFCLLVILIKNVQLLYGVYNWMIRLRTEALQEAHAELKDISIYRLLRLEVKQIWRQLKLNLKKAP